MALTEYQPGRLVRGRMRLLKPAGPASLHAEPDPLTGGSAAAAGVGRLVSEFL